MCDFVSTSLINFFITIFVQQNQTEIAYLSKHKESLLQNMSPEERNHRVDICNKLKEKASIGVRCEVLRKTG